MVDFFEVFFFYKNKLLKMFYHCKVFFDNEFIKIELLTNDSIEYLSDILLVKKLLQRFF